MSFNLPDSIQTCISEAYQASDIELGRSLSFAPNNISFLLRWKISAAVVMDSTDDNNFFEAFRQYVEGIARLQLLRIDY